MIIYLGLPLLAASCSLPEHNSGTHSPFALLDLAPDGVYQADGITAAAGGLLHHRFTLTRTKAGNILLCCTFRQVALPGR